MRLFFAISFPDGVLEQLRALSSPITGVRWISTAGLHLTLQFIGKVDRQMVSRIRDAASIVASERFNQRFDLGLLGVGAFPRSRQPKVLWAGCEVPEALLRLQKDLLSSLQALGLDLEMRPFKAHITVARVRRGMRPEISGWLEQNNDFRTGSFEVQAFHLYSSELGSSGAVYHVVESYSLLEFTTS